MKLKYYWLKASIPAGLIAALIIGAWTYAIGGYVAANALGAFIGIVIAFVIIHILYTRSIS